MAREQALLDRSKLGRYLFLVFVTSLVQRNTSFTIKPSRNQLKNVVTHFNKPSDNKITYKCFSSRELFSCTSNEENDTPNAYPLNNNFKRKAVNFFKIVQGFADKKKAYIAVTSLAYLWISSIGTNKIAHAASSVSEQLISKEKEDGLFAPTLISSTSTTMKKTKSTPLQSPVKNSSKKTKCIKKLTFALLGTTAGVYLGNRIIFTGDKERDDENEKKFNEIMSISDDKMVKDPLSLSLKEPLVTEPLSSTEAMERTKAAEQASFLAAAEKAKAATIQANTKKAAVEEESLKIAKIEKDQMEAKVKGDEVKGDEIIKSEKNITEHMSTIEVDNSGEIIEKAKLETELIAKNVISSGEIHSDKEISVTPEEKKLSKEEKEKYLAEKYASLSLEERAFAILVDLGLVELTPDPDDPSYDNTLDDEYWTENVLK